MAVRPLYLPSNTLDGPREALGSPNFRLLKLLRETFENAVTHPDNVRVCKYQSQETLER